MAMFSLDHLGEEEEEEERRQSLRLSSGRRRHKASRSKRHSSRRGHRHRHRHSRRGGRREHQHAAGDAHTCAVCLGDEGLDCMLAPCKHVFHGECISKWVRVNFSCPLCRQKIGHFIPLSNSKTKVFDEFEKLWADHYTRTSSEQDEQPQLGDDKIAKPAADGVTKQVVEIPTVDVGLEASEALKETTTEPISETTQSIWSSVWNCVFVRNVVPVETFDLSATVGVAGLLVDPTDLQGALETPKDHSSPFSAWENGTPFAFIPAKDHGTFYGVETVECEGYTPVEPSDESMAGIVKQTSVNVSAGLVAGLAASLGNCAGTGFLARVGLRHFPFFLQRSLPPMAGQTAPHVAMFFTLYEHLKAHGFCVDDSEPRAKVYAQRFAAAGIAGGVSSVAFGGSPLLLGLRFGAFFGTFEGIKDLYADTWVRRERQLSVAEVAAAAGVSGVFASALYHGTTQAVRAPVLNLNGALFSAQSPHYLMRGFSRYLVTFMPSCVACSCAFEFSRRAIDERIGCI